MPPNSTERSSFVGSVVLEPMLGDVLWRSLEAAVKALIRAVNCVPMVVGLACWLASSVTAVRG